MGLSITASVQWAAVPLVRGRARAQGIVAELGHGCGHHFPARLWGTEACVAVWGSKVDLACVSKASANSSGPTVSKLKLKLMQKPWWPPGVGATWPEVDTEVFGLSSAS